MIYICVLNYNNSKDTIMCLESLKKLEDVSFKIILVDNKSTDESYEILKKYIMNNKDVVFFRSVKNKGYAAGNNLALKYALQQDDMEYCWILNNDTIVDKYALKYLKAYMDKNPNVGLCGSKLIYEWNRNLLQGYGGFYNPYLAISRTCTDETEISHIDYVIGAACLVSRNFLECVGLMNEKYFLYYEEIDWACRARGKFLLSCVPESIVYHKEGASTGGNALKKKDRSLMSDYFYIRNRIEITKKHYPLFLPIVYLGMIITIANRLIRKQYSRILMIIKIMFGWRDKRFEI